MTIAGVKWKSSLRTRLIAYYENNPTSRLTRQELAELLHTTIGSLHGVIYKLKSEGFIERRVCFTFAPVEPYIKEQK